MVCLRKWPVSVCCDLKSVIVIFGLSYYNFACNILVLCGIYTVCSMAFLMYDLPHMLLYSHWKPTVQPLSSF